MTGLRAGFLAAVPLALLAACNPVTTGSGTKPSVSAPSGQQAQAPVSQRKVDLAQYVREAPIAEAVFSADGSVLATIHQRADARYLGTWNLNDPNLPAIRTMKLGERGELGKHYILSPDGRQMTVRRGDKNELALIDLASFHTVRPLKLGFPRDQIVAGAFSPDGRTLAVVRQFFDGSQIADHVLLLVDIASGSVRASENLAKINHLEKIHVGWLGYAPDGRSILAGVGRNRVSLGEYFHKLEHIGDGAVLFDAKSLTRMATSGISDSARYSSMIYGGRVLPGNHAMALMVGQRKVSIVSLPGGAVQQDLTGKYDERFSHIALADDSTIGIAIVEKDSAARLWIGHLDGGNIYFLRSHPLDTGLPLALAVGKDGEWLVATAQGLRRFPALPPHAGRAALALAEAREMAKIGFADEAFDLLTRALDDDWRVVRRSGMDILLPHSTLLAGRIELKRWRLMRAEGDAEAAWPLFSFGYLAVQAGHPQMAVQAAAALRQEGDFGTALAGYLDALVLAARGDRDGGYRLALAARRALDDHKLETLAERVKIHAQAWQPLYADRAKLAFVVGAGEADLPPAPPPGGAVTPYVDLDGRPLGPGAAARPPAPRADKPAAPRTAAPPASAGTEDPVVLD